VTDSPEVDSAYWAYFSYSHADEKAAVDLHRRLERFRIPPTLRGRRIGDHVADKFLQPVFRDRDELSSSGSLSESLDKALRRSHSLIVLCSPAAAKSEWVNKEIERYIELHGSRRIYPLILEGTPGSGDDRECFPRALRRDGLEPIGGDLQKSGDGEQNALMKVVAGILEVPYDRLKQREAQRRQRRLVGITALTAVIALTTSVLALYAFQQRTEAVEQRQFAEQRRVQAEDLITFMLGDLRERLESLGRLDVLEAVGDEATAYFESLPISELTDNTLASQANALRQIAEIRIQQGRYPEAQVAFYVALTQTTELQKRNPDSPDVLFDRSQAEYWVGYSHYLSRDYPEAERYFRQYQESTNTLVESDPDDPDYRMELAYAYSNLGTVAQDLHQSDKALAAFRQSRDIFAELYESDRDDLDMLFEVAATDSWLGRVYKTRYDLENALEYYEQSAATHADVFDGTGHFFHRQMEAESLSNLSEVRFGLGDIAGALRDEEHAAGIYRELVHHDEENLDWQVQSLLHDSQVLWLDYLKAPESGQRRQMDILLRDAEQIAAADPDNGDWSGRVFHIALDTMYMAFLDNDIPLADELLRRYAGDDKSVEELGKADRNALQNYLRFRTALSIRSYLSGNTERAVASARVTLALFEHHPEILSQHLENAVFLYRAGDETDESRELEQKLRTQGFRSPSFLRTLALLDDVMARQGGTP
jgi:tetratricopeptide (TPR) repeat protein